MASEFIDLDEIEKIAESWGVYSDERGLMSWRLPALVRAVRAALALDVVLFDHFLRAAKPNASMVELDEALAPFRKEAT